MTLECDLLGDKVIVDVLRKSVRASWGVRAPGPTGLCLTEGVQPRVTHGQRRGGGDGVKDYSGGRQELPGVGVGRLGRSPYSQGGTEPDTP